jgi:cytochrome c oxidase subunit II
LRSAKPFSLSLLVSAPLSAGCGGVYSALDRVTREGSRITSLHWLMYWICVGFFVAMMGLIAASLESRARARTPEGERRRTLSVAAGAAVSTLLLLLLLAVSVTTGHAIVTPPGPEALEIDVIGHQWWWEVHYPASTPSDEITTANEIHVPVGRAVRLQLSTGDVIHSFWVPNIHGKKDLIPGRRTTHVFRAERTGTFRGQCAEFCGYQHAHMGLVVFVQKPEVFQSWLDHQRRLASEPSGPAEQHGREVFLSGPCVLCHTIRGAGAFGHKAPDLTHLASRTTIAAGTLPNKPGHLAGWVVDAQRIKPGNRMPPNVVASNDLNDLVSYLVSLR